MAHSEPPARDDRAPNDADQPERGPHHDVVGERALGNARVFAVIRNVGATTPAEPEPARFPLSGWWSVPLVLTWPLWRFRYSPLRRPGRALVEWFALRRSRRPAARDPRVPPGQAR